ncbi:MAG: hypothetical protein A2156_14335 [Deltaproteobacteria bacterium RBG_16_48_10]|nr:MAG: hypothetical protein A2156_14335 [Deltaproteobacteria bacterium RBG_16_48_10]
MKKRVYYVAFLFVFFLTGCMGPPVRDAVKVYLSVPVGKVENNQFSGIRYPFKISAPPNWKVTMEIPEFMESMGYEKDGLQESEVFVYNPETKSNLQIDFVPAGRYAKFSQESIEWITEAARGSFKEELEKDYGAAIKVEYGPTTAYSLKGVPYAAKKYATYTLKGVKREQGWIYAFTEPYQIFILYMILEKEGTKEGANDREEMKKILDSFEVFSKQ